MTVSYEDDCVCGATVLVVSFLAAASRLKQLFCHYTELLFCDKCIGDGIQRQIPWRIVQISDFRTFQCVAAAAVDLTHSVARE